MKKHDFTSLFNWMKNHNLSKKALRVYYFLACNASNGKYICLQQNKMICLCRLADKLELVSAVNELIYNNLINVSWNTGAENKVSYPVYTLLEIGDKKP